MLLERIGTPQTDKPDSQPNNSRLVAQPKHAPHLSGIGDGAELGCGGLHATAQRAQQAGPSHALRAAHGSSGRGPAGTGRRLRAAGTQRAAGCKAKLPQARLLQLSSR